MDEAQFEAIVPFVGFGALGLFVVVFAALMVRGTLADRRWHRELEENGIDGTAVVLDVRDISEPQSVMELMLTLRVSFPGAPDREVRQSTRVPVGKDRVVREGEVLRVRAHPRDRTFFTVIV